MPRVVSFIVLVAIVLIVGSLFFQVMMQFILPLFLAGILVVIFKPMHLWFVGKCGKYNRVAAFATTFSILLVVLVPLTAMLWNGYSETMVVVAKMDDIDQNKLWETVQERAAKPLSWLSDLGVSKEKVTEILDTAFLKTKELAVPIAFGGLKIALSLLVGGSIMMLAVYYFFADGPGMVEGIMKLSPLDDKYEIQLLEQFANISRAVVVATLLSAVVQGLLAGIGYYFVGVGPVFLLTGLTMLLSMVPFIGGAAVWVPTAIWVALLGGEKGEGDIWLAVYLAVYCASFVSMSDNVVKPYVLKGQSNLHPLLALLSVLGGAQVLGPIGILVGPMVVAFLQALLNMLQMELESFGEPGVVSPMAEIKSAMNEAISEQPAPEKITAPKKQGSSKKSHPKNRKKKR